MPPEVLIYRCELLGSLIRPEMGLIGQENGS